MTPSSTRFVAPLTLAALSRRHVDAEVLDLLPDGRIGHVLTADAADAILVAPATAHWLGAMAHGLAADVVTATCLATAAPVVVAPAMDGDMYAHPATQANVAILRDRFGYAIVEPESGPSPPGRSGRAAWPTSARSSTPSSTRSATARCAGPTRPIARRAFAACRGRGARPRRRRPGRPARRRHGRRHGRADRPGPLHRQPQHRDDGRRRRRGGARPRGAGDARRRRW